jgi:hypothetical protein
MSVLISFTTDMDVGPEGFATANMPDNGSDAREILGMSKSETDAQKRHGFFS